MTRKIISYDQINIAGEETSSTQQDINLTGKRKQEEENSVDNENTNNTIKYKETGKLNKKQKKLLKKMNKEQITDNNLEVIQHKSLSFNPDIHKVQGPIKIEEIQYRIISTVLCRVDKDPLFTNINNETKLLVGVIPKLDQLLSIAPIKMKKNPFKTSELFQSESLSISTENWLKFQDNFKYSFVSLGKANNENLQNFVLGLMQYRMDSGDVHEKLKYLEKTKSTKYQNEFQRLMLKKHEMIGSNIVTSLEEVENIGQNPDDWIETCKEGEAFSNPQKIYAIDCEMCESSKGRELARISIVNYNNEVILDELVIPENEIIEYKTQYSGITEEILKNAKFTFKEIQAKVLEIFNSGCILVGHAIMNDLSILKLIHPYIIDTSTIYHHSMGPPYLPSLKWLTKKFLNKDIQVINGDRVGHDSVEDAIACIDLLKLKIRNGPHFGLTKTNSESVIEYLSRKASNFSSALVSSDSRIHIWGNDSELVKSASVDQVLDDTQKAVKNNRFVVFHNPELNRVFNTNNKIENNTTEVETEKVEKVEKVSSESNEVSVDIEAANNFIKKLNDFIQSLPSNTAVILLGGHSTNLEFNRICQKKKNYSQLYKNTKFSEMPEEAAFTNADSRRMRQLVEICRMGLGFLAVKP